MTAPDPAGELTSHEIRQQILDRIDASPRAMWIRAAYDLGHVDGEIRERQRIRDGIEAIVGFHVVSLRIQRAINAVLDGAS